MVLSALRGVSRVTAAVTGLLLVYGAVYALEGMTTRIPTTPAREFAVTAAWMIPWMLLLCSGLEDLETVTRRAWVFWLGVTAGLIFLYYFERHTASATLTKAAMPPVAMIGGVLPHIVRRIRLLFILCSLVAAFAGLLVLYLTLSTFLSRASSFATKTIAFLVVAFVMTSLAAGALSVAPLGRKVPK